MKKFILFILFISTSYLGHSQEYFGTTVFGDVAGETNYNIAKDSQGNIYTVGFYSGTITLGSTTVTWAGGNADAYLTKHDSNGNPVWIKSFGGTLDDVAIALTIDASDNILLTGYFQGSGTNSFDADPGPNVYPLAQQATIISRDCFIIKLNSSGDFVWAKQVSNPTGGALNEDSKTIKTDTFGNVYVAGAYRFADFDPSSNSYELTATGTGSAVDGFLLKLTKDGDFAWVKTFNSAGNVFAESIDIDATGKILVAGRYEQTLDMNPSDVVTENTPVSNGSHDTFLIQLTSDGDYIWGKAFGGSGLDIPKFVKAVGNDVYIGGTLYGSQDLDPSAGINNYTINGFTDGYISKFDTNGNYLLSYVIGGTESSGTEEMYAMTVGPNGNLFITGDYAVTTDFDYSAATANSTSNGSLDSFVLEITPAGNYVNHIVFGGTAREAFPKLEFAPNNKIIMTGSFLSSSINFDPYGGTNILNNAAGGTFDAYVSVFSWPGIVLSNEDFATNEIKVYPNPVKNSLFINDSTGSLQNYTLFNTVGQTIKTGAVTPEINLNDISNGIYILQLEGENGVITKRMVKE